MTDAEEIRKILEDTIGKEGCSIPCAEPDIFRDAEGWKMQLPTFMEPWKLGKNVDEAKQTIIELASQGFGLA